MEFYFMLIAFINNFWGAGYGHYLMQNLESKYLEVNITIYYCSLSERNRKYKIQSIEETIYNKYHLKGEISWGIDKHFNFGIFPLILKNQYDFYLIGGYSYPTVALAILLCRFLKRKYILIIDHMYKKIDKRDWFKNTIKTFLVKCANAYITTSEEAKENLIYYGANRDKIFIAPLSCPDFFFLDYQHSNKNFEKPFDRYLLFIGHFEEYKGIKYLLEAFKIVKSKFSDINLILIGSGPLEQYINKFIKDNNFNDSIKVYNWLPYRELPFYYCNALMFVCPSTYEPWAFVVNEAMASGLPVIASSAVGAARALIRHGENGFIVPPKDSQKISEKIIALLNNDNLRIKISQNAYQTAKKYTIDKISDIYYQVFNCVLNQT